MVFKEFIKSFSSERWNIGFIQNSMSDIINGEAIHIKWLKHSCKDSWFADPFILDVTDDEIIVLAEEWYKPIQRGRISKLTIDRYSYELKKLDVVLVLDTHLSFPIIERRAKDVYIYPENGEAGGLWMYKYTPETNKIELLHKILDEPVEDAVITDLFGNKYMFATKRNNPNGNLLSVYLIHETSGKAEYWKEYHFDENVARMAGNFFVYESNIYRPTQECNYQYGHAITLQKVFWNEGEFRFDEVRRIYSVHPTLNVGTHTFNMYKDVIVTDALGFDNKWIRTILKLVGIKK